MSIYLLYIPIVFLGNAMGQVFYKKICVWKSSEQISSLAFKMLKLNFFLGLLPVLLLIFVGKSIFSFALGQQWEVCGNYSLLMTLWVWALFCFTPLNFIFFSKDKQKISFYIYLSLFVFRILIVLIGGSLNSIVFTIFFYGLVGLILTCLQGYLALNLCGVNVKQYLNVKVLLLLFAVIVLWCNKVYFLFL